MVKAAGVISPAYALNVGLLFEKRPEEHWFACSFRGQAIDYGQWTDVQRSAISYTAGPSANS
jgi:hypothetical protein